MRLTILIFCVIYSNNSTLTVNTSMSELSPPPLKLFFATKIWGSFSSLIVPRPQDINDLNIFCSFCKSKSWENKNVEHFFFQKNFVRARAKYQSPQNLGVVPFVSNPKKTIYRNFSNEHSNSQKEIWRARAVPIHKFRTSNIFFVLIVVMFL